MRLSRCSYFTQSRRGGSFVGKLVGIVLLFVALYVGYQLYTKYMAPQPAENQADIEMVERGETADATESSDSAGSSDSAENPEGKDTKVDGHRRLNEMEQIVDMY